ncbi:MAG: hypothetical protein JNL69_01585 [Bacteroidia bacterium]|nr:hypothetical protein [Bacteroidia bacterium]
MKTYLLIFVSAIFVFASCSTQNGLATKNYEDDIYYSSKDAAADKEKKKVADEQAKTLAAIQAEQKAKEEEDYYTSKKQTQIVEEKPFDYDDYYDYEYSTRLRRFHNNCGSYGYYDNYYTNSYYYTGNPYNYGTSVYMGYSWWGPSYVTYNYYPSYSWYSSYGWGYDPWYNPYGYYNPYAYNPYGYYGYNPYMMNGYNQGYYNGYNQGYWNGYNQGYWNGNYFNSYDNNSYYYGPRKTTGSNSRTTSQPSLAQRYVETVEAETGKPFEATYGRDNNPYAVGTTVNDYLSKPTNTNNNTIVKPAGTVNPAFKPSNADDYTRPSNNKPVQNDDYYTKPNNTNDYTKPNNKPVYNETKPLLNIETKPSNQGTTKPREDNYQQKPQTKPNNDIQKYEPVKPRAEQPSYEQQKYTPPASTPSRGNGGSSAPQSQPRKR